MAPKVCDEPTMPRSAGVPRRIAARMPSVTPTVVNTTAAMRASTTVFGKRVNSSVLTDCRVEKE
jgi:hypothetical protein